LVDDVVEADRVAGFANQMSGEIFADIYVSFSDVP
jgi:hypothetical protein